ncbi:glycosyltransferase family 4 protein [Edaphobacter aggregans]|uniref:glycosyltransferase family 4 protein n=1 Tax=Edaphobacter aggregans TaxID=570835 RepID=UPI00068B136B|nr:glycosyltransferase family 4 protein [Edaphobacter aggregans]
MNLARIGMVSEGNASVSETVFSGTAKRMFLSLQQMGHEMVPVDASMNRWERGMAALASLSPDRARWRSRFRYGNAVSRLRTASALRSMKGAGNGAEPDVLLQIGAAYDPPGDLPYAVYCDWNMALDVVEAKDGHSRGLSVRELENIGREHARRYRNAALVFTISERLRQSFIELYGLSPEKVRTAYAGPNFDLRLIDEKLEQPKTKAAPTVLFIAKEFKRKGGDVVAAAFTKLQSSMTSARLVFAGAATLPAELSGLSNITHLGLLDKSDPAQLQRLLDAYRQADVLVLPSNHDPFPTVIREAMFFGLPCVASNIWAMPEMIVDGSTGFLIEPGDPEALCKRLELLLGNPDLRARLGQAARSLADTKFSWSSVGQVLHEGLQDIYRKAERTECMS